MPETTRNIAKDNARVGVQAGTVNGGIHVSGERHSPADLAQALVALRARLREAREAGHLDDETYAAAAAELSVADEELRSRSPSGRGRLILALKKVRGLIGDVADLVSFEADAARIIAGAADQRVIAHANHPLYDPPVKPELEPVYAASNTRARLACMTDLASGASTLDDIERSLTNTTAPISRAASHGFMTLGAMAAELTIPPRVAFAAGPPHLRPFVEVSLAATS